MQALLDSLITPASDQADQIHQLWVYFVLTAGAVLLLVVILLGYILMKYRAKPTDGEPIQRRDNKTVERWMIAGPAILVGIFFYLTLTTMQQVESPINGQRPDVIITGHQFWWEVYYPDDSLTTANEIHLPVGKKLLIQLKSADVIHDWWVPALGNKMDLIPGRDNHVWVTLQRPGTYQGTCSEFCGAQHAWMRIHVVAQNPEEFTTWVQQGKRPAQAPTDALARKGKDIFLTASCSTCHTIQGTSAQGTIGPDLTHLGSRATLLSGMLSNTQTHLEHWIQGPQQLKPGSLMPKFIYRADTIEALVAYVSQLH